MEEKAWKSGIYGALFLILLGISVIIGWWTGTIWLIRGLSISSPVYFNTALLFIILGVGTLSYLLGMRRIALISALIGGVFTIILLFDHFLEWDVVFQSKLYLIPEAIREQLHTCRCGLNTLFSFICLFLALFLINRKTLKPVHLLFVGLFSGLTLAIIIVALWGYVSGVESAYSWGRYSRMALFTAIGLFVASLLFLAAATRKLKEIDRSILPVWTAVLVGVILFSTTLAFTRVLFHQQISSIQQIVESRVKEHGRALDQKIRNVMSDLDRMSKREPSRANTPSEEWRNDARNYLHDLKGLVGIVSLSETGKVIQKKWSPTAYRQELENELESIKKQVLNSKETFLHLSTTVNRPHLLYIIPMTDQKIHLVGVLSLDELLTDLIPSYWTDETGLEIDVDGQKVYGANLTDTTYKNLESKTDIPFFNTDWQLTFWPTTKFIQAEHSYFPLTAFFFGSVISLFIAMLTYLAQKSLQESRLIASRNLARSAFLAQVSHELRTPLSGIIASVDILEHTHMDQKQSRLLDIMRSSGQHLLTIINEVLDLAKLEAGKIPLEPSFEDVNKVATDLIALLLPKAHEKGIFLVLHSDVPQKVFIDPTRLRQILNNLVGNGIKFTEKGGVTVDISYKPLHQKGRLLISVQDTGIGITKEHQALLFEKFTQVGKRNVPGSGLGLYITRAIVEIMGGSISFTSSSGVGSTFNVVLPVVPQET